VEEGGKEGWREGVVVGARLRLKPQLPEEEKEAGESEAGERGEGEGWREEG